MAYKSLTLPACVRPLTQTSIFQYSVRMPTTDDKKIIYSMYRLSKRNGTKQVLKDISLSYFYGAKIGVIGLNGSGKSTLLRIMAGLDTEYSGEVACAPGYTIG